MPPITRCAGRTNGRNASVGVAVEDTQDADGERLAWEVSKMDRRTKPIKIVISLNDD